MPTLLVAGVLLLQGCSLLPKKDAEATAGARPVAGDTTSSDAQGKDADPREAFTLDVKGPDKVREYLAQNLEIQRYSRIPDLGATELSRLMVAAEANARELLATLGYFTPTLTLELNETPGSGSKAPREVVVTVDPGPTTQVTSAQILFNGPIENDTSAAAQRDTIRRTWSLPPGASFTQQAWDNAKTAGLRNLTAKRYATASVVTSRADIDADNQQAKLGITYQSGPAYRFGPLKISESQRYDPDAMRRVARVPTGEDYDQQKLLDAQQRMASSGYFDSVFLTLDTEASDPLTAPVLAQVREAPLQKVVAGVGFTTDSGPRLSLDHIHNQVPLLGWRAVSKLSIDNNTRSLGTELNSIPNDNGWRWVNSAQIKRENAGTYDVDSGRLRSGRSKAEDHIDRGYYLQYDYAKNRGDGAPPSAAAVSGNWAWTARYFDNNATPSRGFGVALELGAGYTLIGERLPFTRSFVRGLGFIPLGDVTSSDGSQARNSRIQLRGDLGAVIAKDAAQIPSTLMFLTGGDTTVRGYSYQQIGTERADGTIVAGRYLSVISAEWQRPFVWNGKLTEWESAVFVDAGAVADTPGDLKTKVGVGVGARWRSPFGPVQADVAYGEATRKFRLHLRLGFTF